MSRAVFWFSLLASSFFVKKIEGISVFGFDLLFCDHHGSLDLFERDKHDDVPRPQPQKWGHKSAKLSRKGEIHIFIILKVTEWLKLTLCRKLLVPLLSSLSRHSWWHSCTGLVVSSCTWFWPRPPERRSLWWQSRRRTQTQSGTEDCLSEEVQSNQLCFWRVHWSNQSWVDREAFRLR